MNDKTIWFTPPILFISFIFLACLMMVLGKRIAAKGDENPEKFIHYSCGEDLDVQHLELDYHAFFRLALLFGILHIVALIISTTVSTNINTKFYSVMYVIGAAVSMLILLERDEDKE